LFIVNQYKMFYATQQKLYRVVHRKISQKGN
jgi:hypothetical protein